MTNFEKIFELVDRYKLTFFLALAGTLLIGLGFLLPKINTDKKPIVITDASSSSDKDSQLKVDIEGAVKNPGVYSLNLGARVLDVIYAAGGFTDQTDSNWLTKNINLAALVSDGEKIYINALGEEIVLSQSSSSQVSSGKININSASSSQLDTLPGIGEKTASKIINSRPYKSINELLDKKVVGTATFNKIKDLVSAN